jgi:hypothetical protein
MSLSSECYGNGQPSVCHGHLERYWHLLARECLIFCVLAQRHDRQRLARLMQALDLAKPLT